MPVLNLVMLDHRLLLVEAGLFVGYCVGAGEWRLADEVERDVLVVDIAVKARSMRCGMQTFGLV